MSWKLDLSAAHSCGRDSYIVYGNDTGSQNMNPVTDSQYIYLKDQSIHWSWGKSPNDIHVQFTKNYFLGLINDILQIEYNVLFLKSEHSWYIFNALWYNWHLILSGKKPLPEPMLTEIPDAILMAQCKIDGSPLLNHWSYVLFCIAPSIWGHFRPQWVIGLLMQIHKTQQL